MCYLLPLPCPSLPQQNNTLRTFAISNCSMLPVTLQLVRRFESKSVAHILKCDTCYYSQLLVSANLTPLLYNLSHLRSQRVTCYFVVFVNPQSKSFTHISKHLTLYLKNFAMSNCRVLPVTFFTLKILNQNLLPTFP